MVKIKEFYIVGLGALGGMYGSLAVANKEKNDNLVPKFIVDSERKHKYVKNDIYVNGVKQHFEFVTPEEQALKAAKEQKENKNKDKDNNEDDEGLIVVMICTKYMALRSALEQCRPFVCLPPSEEEEENKNNNNNNKEEETGTLSSRLRPNVVIFSVINGITKESIMTQYYPKSAVVAGVAQTVAGRTTTTDDNENNNNNNNKNKNENEGQQQQPKERINIVCGYVGKIHIGEADGDTTSPRLHAMANYFNNAGITCEIQGNIRHIMWSKFMLNVGVSQAVTAAMGGYGDIQKTAAFKQQKEKEGTPVTKEERYNYQLYNNPQAREWMMTAMQEALTLSHFVPCYDFSDHPAPKESSPEALAKRQEMINMKINLNDDDVAYWDDVMQAVDGQQAPSMRQDIGAGRPTELALFAETIIELGKKYQVPTPVNEELYERISALEKNF